MQTNVIFLDCPAYMDDDGAVRCGLPAAVEYRYTCESTDGPLESARIQCPRGHVFNGPLEYLTFTSGVQATPARSRMPSGWPESDVIRDPRGSGRGLRPA
jgi:hypothetical protein